MNELFSAQIILAMVGGAIGSARNFARNGATQRLDEGIVNVLVGTVFAAAAGERFAAQAHPVIAMVIGLCAGAVGGYALDALQALIPAVVKSIVMGWAERIGGTRKDLPDEEP